MFTPQDKAECASYFIETKSDIQGFNASNNWILYVQRLNLFWGTL